MKILVVGGMHGNEPLGLEVARLFTNKPVKSIDTILANKPAIRRGVRFVKNDLNRSFPGNATSADCEIKRAAELLARARKYDLVLDFHNTHCPDNDCGFLGVDAESAAYDAAAWLGLRRVIVADYDCVNKYAPNCLSVEISLSSSKMNAEWWYKRVARLASLSGLPTAKNVKKYRFVYRMTLADRDRLDLQAKNLKAFRPIDRKLARQMRVNSPAYPIFIGDSYTPYNYGGLLNGLG